VPFHVVAEKTSSGSAGDVGVAMFLSAVTTGSEEKANRRKRDEAGEGGLDGKKEEKEKKKRRKVST